MRSSIAAALMISAFACPAAAQSRATITDSRLILERSGAAPDTFLVHTISAGSRHRSEYRVGKSPYAAFGAKPGSVEIMNVADSGMTIDFLDPATKTYSELKPAGIVKGAMEMLKSMGTEMKTKYAADSASIDSLGDGGIVAGHKTLHFRTHFTATMAMSFLGDSVRAAMTDTVDTYVAPDLKDATDSAASTKVLEDMKNSVKGMIPFDAGEILARMSEGTKRIASAGVPLKTVNSVTTNGMGRVSSQHTTTEILKFERAVVPDSLFQIPADYKKVELMLWRRAIPPDSSR